MEVRKNAKEEMKEGQGEEEGEDERGRGTCSEGGWGGENVKNLQVSTQFLGPGPLQGAITRLS